MPANEVNPAFILYEKRIVCESIFHQRHEQKRKQKTAQNQRLSDSSQSSTEAPFRREQLLGPGEFNETISKETVGLKQLAIDRFWQYFLPIPMENLKKLQGLTSNVVFL